jgi:hypothetical protein
MDGSHRVFVSAQHTDLCRFVLKSERVDTQRFLRTGDDCACSAGRTTLLVHRTALAVACTRKQTCAD